MLSKINIKTITILLLSMFILITPTVAHASTSDQRIDALDTQLENANTVTLKEKFFRLSTEYEILIKNKKVGSIQGDFWHPLGDTIRIETTKGDIVYSEEQSRRLLHLSIKRGGIFYDKNDNFDGSIEEKPFNLFFHQFEITDHNTNVSGNSFKDPWHFFRDIYLIKNNENKTIFNATASHTHLTTHIKIRKLQPDSDISMKKAMIITAIEEAIEADADN